jgi:hypothetical protein
MTTERRKFWAVGLELFDTATEAMEYAEKWGGEAQHVEDVLASDVIGNTKKIDLEIQMENMLDELMEMETHEDVDAEIYLASEDGFEEAAEELSLLLKKWADRHLLTNKWRLVKEDEEKDAE